MSNKTVTRTIDLYDELYKVAVDEPMDSLAVYGLPINPGATEKIFRGGIYATGKLIGLNNAQTHNTMNVLYAMRCVTKLLAGSQSSPSVLMFHYKPTEEQVEKFTYDSRALARKIAPSITDGILDELANLRLRVKALEEKIEGNENGNRNDF